MGLRTRSWLFAPFLVPLQLLWPGTLRWCRARSDEGHYFPEGRLERVPPARGEREPSFARQTASLGFGVRDCFLVLFYLLAKCSLNLHLWCHVSLDLWPSPAYFLVHTSLNGSLLSGSGLEETKWGKLSTEGRTGSSFCSALMDGRSTAVAVQLAGKQGMKLDSLLTTAWPQLLLLAVPDSWPPSSCSWTSYTVSSAAVFLGRCLKRPWEGFVISEWMSCND